MPSARWMPACRYGVPGLLAGLVLAWSLGSGRPPEVRAQAPLPQATDGTIALTTPAAGPGSAQSLFLIDTRNQVFAVYRVEPQNPNGAVKLEAVRQYRWDLKLDEYNNQKPEASAIKSWLSSGSLGSR